MALVVTFRLPVEVCSALLPGKKGAQLQSGIKQLLLDGLRERVSIGDTEVAMHVSTERFNLSVPEEQGTEIRALANEMGVTPRHICQGILLSMASRHTLSGEKTDPKLASIIKALKKGGRKLQQRAEQARFYDYLMDALGSGSIGLCEAGTGTGKTLAMLAAAKAILDDSPERRLAITCPTLMLMEQFARQYDEMVDAGIGMPDLRVVIGRREFVSPVEVMRVAQSGNVDPDVDLDAVMRWVEDGGMAHESHWIRSPWLAGTLAKIAPGFPVAAATLSDTAEEEDPGIQAYRAQFQVDEEDPAHEIILCTHSMLAVDIRRRMLQVGRDDEYRKISKEITGLFKAMSAEGDGEQRKEFSAQIAAAKAESLQYGAEISRDAGALPPFHFLMVDEAHMLEQAFSNALSNYVSLYAFWRGLEEYRQRGGRIAAKSINHIASQMKKMALLAVRGDLIPLDRNEPTSQAATDLLKEMCHAAGVISSVRNDAQDSLLDRLKRELKMLCAAGEQRSFSRAYAQFSPVRAFPRIFMGAPTVDHALSFLWASCSSAVCVSATLYMPRGDGFSSAYQAGILAVPKDRQREYAPVVPEWIFSTVSGVFLPKKESNPNGGLWLRPPTRSDELSEVERDAAEKTWLSDLARALSRIHADAAGGVLVLMTSYKSVEILTSLLPGDLRKALVSATPDISLATQRARYLSHAHHGRKPLWLAVGGAWTGLDIGGHRPWAELFGDEIPAESDNVLTDLVIPRIPFGTNKSMTHLTRLERNSTVPWELLDAVFRIKQAMGRPVRRGGLPANRRIFILDGRINDQKFAGYLSRITALAKGYNLKLFGKTT